jgi:Domain of unknown function (DUF3291)
VVANLRYHVAQVNVGLPLEPLSSARLAAFVAALEPINALADRSPGFVWRMQTEDGDATAVRGFGDDRLIINMSVWESVETLGAYVFGSGHVEIMRRRREWFEPLRESVTALWWLPAGQLPTVADAESRLAHLRTHGPTPTAFTLRRSFPPPGVATAPPPSANWSCPA